MTDNYARIVQENLNRFYQMPLKERSRAMLAGLNGELFKFNAFGRTCRISRDGVKLDGELQTGVYGMLILLYAIHAGMDDFVVEPLKAFKDFKNSMPYTGAFTTHAENILVPHVRGIEKAKEAILERFRGRDAHALAGGDFSFLVQAFPKVFLCYIFYHADEEFPASVKCLFSNNASIFLPIDALADTGEYTSREILSIVT